ncbi:MAG TPA: TetR family transcriptional regulator [Gemmatimonadaceae bacterium]
MSPRARTTPRETAGGIRERILNAALAILREEGIQALSQVQVARRARVRQSHLTYYFPKRHDLLAAVAERFIGGLVHGTETAAAEAAATGANDAGAMLERMAAAIADPGHMRMFAGVIVEADGDPELHAMVVRATRRLQSTLAERLGGDDAMERAQLVLATLWGVGLYRFAVRPRHGSPLTSAFLADVAEAGTRARLSRSRPSPTRRA